jgi:transposase InsO family protein
MCKMLAVSESGYYEWRKRPVSLRARADKELSAQIEPIFEQSRQTYGSPRVKAALKLKGISCSKKRVARLMRVMGLVSCHRRKKRKVVTTDSNHPNPVVRNLLNRDFTATGPTRNG